MKEDLIKEIEILRKQMVQMGDRLGLGHPFVLILSRKIDLLHTELTKIQLEKQYKQKGNKGDRIFEQFSIDFQAPPQYA